MYWAQRTTSKEILYYNCKIVLHDFISNTQIKKNRSDILRLESHTFMQMSRHILLYDPDDLAFFQREVIWE